MKKSAEVKQIRATETKALAKELADLNKKLTELRFKSSFRQLKNYHEITLTRKKIARIWTIMSEKAAVKYQKQAEKGTL